MSPQNDNRFKSGLINHIQNGPGSSNSPAGALGHKKKFGDEPSNAAPGTASLGQKMMSYFYNK